MTLNAFNPAFRAAPIVLTNSVATTSPIYAQHFALRRVLGIASALDRLSRYEHTLWRQVAQILFALENLNRWKHQERKRSRFDYPREQPFRARK